MAISSPPLLCLPPELILEISDYLPPDGILALKFTHPVLYTTLPLDIRLRNVTLSNCARLAIRTYLRRPDPRPSHMRCILCKTVYPANLFSSSNSPACIPISFSNSTLNTDVVELPRRFCAWHVGRLARIIHTKPGGRNEWVSQTEEMCMHCGAVQQWGKCECDCDSCGSRAVRTYTRYLNNNHECKKFVFWRDAATGSTKTPQIKECQLYVRETCLDPDATEQRTSINLLVQFEDAANDDPVSSHDCSISGGSSTYYRR